MKMMVAPYTLSVCTGSTISTFSSLSPKRNCMLHWWPGRWKWRPW